MVGTSLCWTLAFTIATSGYWLLLTRRRLAVLTGLIISIVWLVLQFRQWYLPYLFNAGSTEWFFDHGYDETIKILPPIEGHAVTLDLQHNILQLLSAVVIVMAVFAFQQVMRQSSSCR